MKTARAAAVPVGRLLKKMRSHPADGAGSIGSFKKSELVNSLLGHFTSAHAAAEPTPAQRKAREWLPEAMLFPAVDPSTPQEPKAGHHEELDAGDLRGPAVLELCPSGYSQHVAAAQVTPFGCESGAFQIAEFGDWTAIGDGPSFLRRRNNLAVLTPVNSQMNSRNSRWAVYHSFASAALLIGRSGFRAFLTRRRRRS